MITHKETRRHAESFRRFTRNLLRSDFPDHRKVTKGKQLADTQANGPTIFCESRPSEFDEDQPRNVKEALCIPRLPADKPSE
jgi:hypothetical protein